MVQNKGTALRSALGSGSVICYTKRYVHVVSIPQNAFQALYEPGSLAVAQASLNLLTALLRRAPRLSAKHR